MSKIKIYWSASSNISFKGELIVNKEDFLDVQGDIDGDALFERALHECGFNFSYEEIG